MSHYNERPAYKATYDLLLAIFQFTKDFYKEYTNIAGERMKKEKIALIRLTFQANVRYDQGTVPGKIDINIP